MAKFNPGELVTWFGRPGNLPRRVTPPPRHVKVIKVRNETWIPSIALKYQPFSWLCSHQLLSFSHFSSPILVILTEMTLLNFGKKDCLGLKVCPHCKLAVVCCVSVGDKYHYYSFKIFLRFWLAKITRISHHNQLLVTKFGRIVPYWIDDVKSTAKLQIVETVNREDLRKRLNFWLKT